jgi:hypothetical protein
MLKHSPIQNLAHFVVRDVVVAFTEVWGLFVAVDEVLAAAVAVLLVVKATRGPATVATL